MSILIDGTTNVVVQGLTGSIAKKHALNMEANNTKIVAGVVPQKGGTYVGNWPIYDTMQQALDCHQVDLSLIYTSPVHAADAIIESIEAGIKIIVCVTEGTPVHDMLRVHKRLAKSKSILVGPCSPGIFSPGKAKAGFIPDIAGKPGNIGVVGKSGTLTYEVCYQLANEGMGQSTIVGIGGDPIKGITFIETMELFENDEETNMIVMVGEIGGMDEEQAAQYIIKHVSKPVIAFIAGKTAPEDVPMGHAGALISSSQGGYAEKVKRLKENGVHIAASIADVTRIVKELITP